MTHNDILRRICHIFEFNDSKIIDIFSLADHQVTQEQVSAWLKEDDDPAYQKCGDNELAIFLNGLINYKRGKKEGAQPELKKRLTNNAVLVKLKIALDLKAEDITAIMTLAGMSLGRNELSTLFRRPGHKHYRFCDDQILEGFLNGMQLKYRPEIEEKTQGS